MLLPTHNARPSTHFHLSGAHQTSSFYPAGNSSWWLYFHSNSHLLSSATTSHVYESVHLPRGYVHLLSLLLFLSLLLSLDTFLNVKYLQGHKDRKSGKKKRWSRIYLRLFNSPIMTWRTNETTVMSSGQVDSATAVSGQNRCVVA